MSEKEKRTQKDSAKSESTNQQEFQNMQAPSENQTKDCVTLEDSRLTWCFQSNYMRNQMLCGPHRLDGKDFGIPRK